MTQKEMKRLETEPTSAEMAHWKEKLGYANIIRRQIQKVVDTMGPALTGSTVSMTALAVQGLRSLLNPYMEDKDREPIDAIMQQFEEKYGNRSERTRRDLTIPRYKRSLRIFEALLDIAMRAGILLEEDIIEGARQE